METSEQPRAAAAQNCPLGPLSELLTDCTRYYVPASLGGGRPDGTARGKSVRHLDEENVRIEFDGRIWEYVRHIPVKLDLAPDDHRSGGPNVSDFKASHMHAWFQLDHRSVHVDYVRFISYGPAMGVDEFLIFVDGIRQGRGGFFFCPPGMSGRTWPIAVPLDSQLLLLDKMPHDCANLTDFDGVSLWRMKRTAEQQATIDRVAKSNGREWAERHADRIIWESENF